MFESTATPYKLLQKLAADLTEKFSLRVAFNPEDQLKGPVAALVEGISATLGIAVTTVTEVQEKEIAGRPDMGISVAGLLTGHIELKAPGKGADPKKLKGPDKIQWEKFQDLPNLLYTDGNEWGLFRNGEKVGKLLRLSGDVTTDGKAGVSEADAAAMQELFRDFLRWEPVVPSSPKALAELLAPLCRLLRSDVAESLKNTDSSLAALATDWRHYLFPDADDNQFADAYAQTFTYALLLARLSGETDLTPTEAAKAIRTGHRLLADTLKILGDDVACAEIAVPVNLLERVIAAVDVAALSKKAKGDPWLYFYEDFLAAYDPKMRKDRGVYYTPVEVVQLQVRLVAQLLEERFDAEYSFADPRIVTLDPACGTGTYMLAAFRYAMEKIAATKGPGMKVSAATTAAANMHAFELLVGPYAVAHLRLTQQVAAEGGTLPSDGVHVYLTDTLESPYAPPEHYPALYRPLGDEHQRAQKVKADTTVMVCIGNPPYDRQTIEAGAESTEKRKGGWVRFTKDKDGKEVTGILRDFLTPLEPLGLGVHAKNLYNDYVYFWRWALWKVFEPKVLKPGEKVSALPGIVSFITASSYLRGPGFAGMRQLMRQTFDELWIIDLEGDNLGARKTENVFAIQTPVCIAIGIRNPSSVSSSPANVCFARIVGSANEKLVQLAEVKTFADLKWQDCPTDWTEPFIPVPDTPYASWPLLTEIFPWQANGMQYKRSWPISESQDVLLKRWETLLSAQPEAKGKLLKETEARKVSKAGVALLGGQAVLPAISTLASTSSSELPLRYAYRSFDRQWCLPDSRLCDRPRPNLWQAYGLRQLHLTSLLTEILGEGPTAVATALLPDLHHFRGSFGGAHVIPLWRDAAGSEANITAGILPLLSTTYGQNVSAEDLFSFAYAVLATPRYVEAFWEELRTPGPHLPIPKEAALFARLTAAGRELIWLHTYGERLVPTGQKPGRIPVGTAKCLVGTPNTAEDYPEDYGYNEEKQELRVGTGVFGGVRREVWDFSVSGFQVVDSWLGYRMKERSGKKSSELDKIRPTSWQFDDELLELLWLLDATVDRLPMLASLFEELLMAEHFKSEDFPKPTAVEQKGPKGGEKEEAEQQSMHFS